MHAPSIHRWKVCVVAMRWRHMFWIVLLAGTLTGFGWYFREIHPKVMGASLEWTCGDEKTPEETEPLILSKPALVTTVRKLELVARWGVTEAQAIQRLNSRVRISHTNGTRLYHIYYWSIDRQESNAIDTVLAELFQAEAQRLSNLEIERWRNERIKIWESHRPPGEPSGSLCICICCAPPVRLLGTGITAAMGIAMLETAGRGIAGVVLAMPFLAYLLEFIFPAQRRDRQPVIPQPSFHHRP